MSGDSMRKISVNRHLDRYDEFLISVNRGFYESTKFNKPLFKTNIENLYDVFLDCIPEEKRQEYNCRCCRNFVNRYGDLVTVDSNSGKLISVMWSIDDVPHSYETAVKTMKRLVERGKIIGAFKTKKECLGIPEAGGFRHLSVDVPTIMRSNSLIKKENELEAEIEENYKLLLSITKRYRIDTVKAAVNLLRSGELNGSERVIGNAEWFLEIIQSPPKMKTNVLWLKAAKAPKGYCHISSNILGTLLDDIESNLSIDSIKQRFYEKIDPLQYMRPKKSPTLGNVLRGEKIVEELGIADSLKRRYAKAEELLKTVWVPKTENSNSEANKGIFHDLLKSKDFKARREVVPDKVITWEKFNRTILPDAKKIEFYVPYSRQNYGAIVTAECQDAPPIFQWDSIKNRNPFSWYVYCNGSMPDSWLLSPYEYIAVTAITLKPNMWQEGFEHQGKGVFFILDGARDTEHERCGAALFPVLLKSELHEIRATIESYSRGEMISGYEESSACGLLLNEQADKWHGAKFRVTTDLGTTLYELDRWD